MIKAFIIILVVIIISSCSWFYPSHEYEKDGRIEISALTGIDTSLLNFVKSYSGGGFSFQGEGVDIFEYDYTGEEDFTYVKLTPEDSLVLFYNNDDSIRKLSDSLLIEFKRGRAGALYCFPCFIEGLAIIHSDKKIWLYDWKI